MAANVWGVNPTAPKPDWADSVDEEAAANGGQLPELPTAAPPLGGDAAFPSLGEAAKPAGKKKGRSRGTTLALSEFQAGSAAPSRPAGSTFRSASAAAARDKSTDIKAQLPKGPRERDENEEKEKLGGGFQDYSGQKARGALPLDLGSSSTTTVSSFSASPVFIKGPGGHCGALLSLFCHFSVLPILLWGCRATWITIYMHCHCVQSDMQLQHHIMAEDFSMHELEFLYDQPVSSDSCIFASAMML